MRHAGLFVLCVASSVGSSNALAQQRPSAKLLQQPDVSATDIVFMYANDLWIAPREGGIARPIASPPGRESFPKFSPDGTKIAFIGNYDGNRDVYVSHVEGGPATRLTYHPAAEVVTDWTSDSKVIYYAAGQAGLARQEHIFTMGLEGGAPTRLPVPYGTTGSISPDGTWLAYTPSTHDFRTWKRYRGGWAQDIWLFNLRDLSSKKITDWEGTDTIPMWAPDGKTLYYLSDDGPSHRLNVWSFDIASGSKKQVTTFSDYDVKWPSIGPGADGTGEIVFQQGESLHLLALPGGTSRSVDIIIPGDRPRLREQLVDASKFIQQYAISPSGKRIAMEARGDIWTVPAAEGVTRNLTRTSGVAERDPIYSPDSKWIAYLSDQTGEYELFLVDADGKNPARQLTTDGAAYRTMRVWSPDSKHIIFGDKTGSLYLHTLGGDANDGSAAGSTRLIAKELWANALPLSWSSDSAWIALLLGHENTQNAIWLYEVASSRLTQVTSEMFDSSWPTFDRKGDWLYFTSSRNFAPTYSDLDSTWIYRNSEHIYAVPLRADVKNPLAPKSDEEESKRKDDAKPAGEKPAFVGSWKGTATPTGAAGFDITFTFESAVDGVISGSARGMGQEFKVENAAWKKEEKTLTFDAAGSDGTYKVVATFDGDTMKATWTGGEGGAIDAKRDADAVKPFKIEVADFERRAIELPVPAGNFSGLCVNDSGKLIYIRAKDPDPDADGPQGGDVKIFDFLDDKADKKEEKTVLSNIQSIQLSADGKRLLARRGNEAVVVDAASDQKFEKKVPMSGMSMTVDPREEWMQIFNDAWRIFRDYFYEAGLHNVDWKAQKEAYGRLLDDAASRDDVTFVIAEMISEFNVGHAYYRPGDQETGPNTNVGLLGADFELAESNGARAYRISRILQGGPWDTDARSPLAEPGVNVREGQYLLAVNRVPIDTTKDIFAAFIGKAGQPTSITVGDAPSMDDTTKEVIVKPIASEANLRLRAWIEDNRRYIEEKSAGAIGYIYVINTGVPGQSDLVRQFYGQRHKAALIIDDRWNGGGQIPTRFIELLNRPRTNYWARRDGKDWAWPRDSHQGPKAMLINGLSASGGDMFPALFRQNGLGKLIGRRTWGGLVGISGNPQFIDGTGGNVPTFGYYETDGTWGIEGHGVDPDIDVIDDPARMQIPAGAPKGTVADPQLDAAISHLLEELKTKAYTPPARPKGPDRKGMGLPAADR